MRKILSIIFFQSLSLVAVADSTGDVMQVYQDLIVTRGLDGKTAPRLQIENVQEKIAAYSKETNTITIEQYAIDICAGFGENRKAALAFILGHELEHFFQHPPYISNFAQAQKGLSNRYREEQADIYGLINSWMAGYDALGISQEVIEQFDKAYKLSEKNLEDYPSLAERLQILEKATKEAKKLIAIYKAASYLSIQNEPFLAAQMYDHLKSKYTTPALLNNTALNYLAEVQQLDQDAPAFILPFEWDWDSRLEQIAQYNGEKDVGESTFFRKEVSLIRAQENLEELAKLHPTYPRLDLNMACLLFLKGNYKELLEDLETAYPEYNPEAELLIALTYLKQGKRSKGVSKLEQLVKSEQPIVAQIARKNLEILAGTWKAQSEQQITKQISFPKSPQTTTKPINLGQWQLFVSINYETGDASILLKNLDEVTQLLISSKNRPCGTVFNDKRYPIDMEVMSNKGSVVRLKTGELFRLSERRKIMEICLVK